jgi:hypothetical protein
MSIVKMSALTISGFALWLAPPFLLSRKIPLHNFTTGLALIGGFVCAFEARKSAIKLAKDEEFEAMKESAIKGDVEDELATSVYISEQERRIEAEAILNSNSKSLEAERKSLEVIYSKDFPASASTSDNPDYLAYLEVRKSMEAGKPQTWIVENVLKMKGRKFKEGKAKLESLLERFSDDDEDEEE